MTSWCWRCRWPSCSGSAARADFCVYELAGIGVACLLVLIFPFVNAPVGFAAVLVVAALVVRRAWTPARAAVEA